LERLPPILTFHLQRFVWDLDTGNRNKVSSLFPFSISFFIHSRFFSIFFCLETKFFSLFSSLSCESSQG